MLSPLQVCFSHCGSKSFNLQLVACKVNARQLVPSNVHSRSEHGAQATAHRLRMQKLKATQQGNDEPVIRAVGIANQRETTLVWRRSTGKPCCNAIVWLDTRTRCAGPLLTIPKHCG